MRRIPQDHTLSPLLQIWLVLIPDKVSDGSGLRVTGSGRLAIEENKTE